MIDFALLFDVLFVKQLFKLAESSDFLELGGVLLLGEGIFVSSGGFSSENHGVEIIKLGLGVGKSLIFLLAHAA